MISTTVLRTKFVKALERDQKRLAGELKAVTTQLAILNGNSKATVAFADTAKHRVDPRAGRKLSAKHRAAIKRGIAARRKADKANGK